MNVAEAAAGKADHEWIRFEVGGVLLEPDKKAVDVGRTPVTMTVANAKALGWLA